MADEIPTDADVLAALEAVPNGLTPTELFAELRKQGHNDSNIVRAIQRVLDRNKVMLTDGARLVAMIENFAIA